MNQKFLEQIDADVQRLTLSEQVWLMERLAQSIRAKTIRQQQMIESQLAMMAADPDIQREINLIQNDFAVTESDGLSANI